jgi:DNA-binding IclR family transcriptional regulator
VAARVLSVFESFSAEHPLRSLSEISRHTGLPLTTAHRLVGELAGWGALERDLDGRYRIGLRLWEVASLAPRSVGLRQSALPFLEDVYEATHQHAQLAVLDGHEVVYLERISSRDAVHVVSRVGGRLPLHATGVGLVLLAHADQAVQEAVLAQPLRRYTARTISSAAELRRMLADVRRDGYVISDGQIELVALSVAAPVHGPNDTVLAALSVVVPAKGSDPHTLVPVVRAAARGISRVLGAPSAQHLARSVRRETHGTDDVVTGGPSAQRES